MVSTSNLCLAIKTKIKILTGEPLNEPIVGYGPFVMNTQDEILQAMYDVQGGKAGKIATQ